MSGNDKRPLSPHLQRYRMPITAIFSILHRATGAVLFLGLLIMIWILVAIANGGENWQTTQGFLSRWQGKGLLFGFSFSLYYHLCNGIRHLLWDIDIGFSLTSVHKSAWIVLLSALLLTVITWIIA